MGAALSLSVNRVEGSENVSANTSQVDVLMQVSVSGNTYNQAMDDYGSITIDGTEISIGAVSVPQYSTVTLYSARHTVTHNADGTKTVQVSGAYNINTSSYQWLYASASVMCNTIPRATTPSVGAVTLGSVATISLPRASDAFTHTLTYEFGSATGTIATGAGTSASWTPPLDLASQIPNAVSGTGTITCTTYNGATVIGTKTISFAASVPTSVVPTSTGRSGNAVNDNPFLAGKDVYVEKYTKLKVGVSAEGAYGSTIKKVAVTCDGKTYTADYVAPTTFITTNALTTAGDISVKIVITDSRGRETVNYFSRTVQPYAAPTISSLAYQRGTYSGGTWTASDTGEDVKVTFTIGLSLTAYSNTASLSVAVDGETTQTTTGAAAGAKIYYFTTIGTDVTRKLTVIATDSTGTAATASADIPTIKVLANVNVDLNSLRVGGVAENADTFRCSLDAKFDKNVSVSGVISGRLANQWDWDYLHKNTSLNAYTDLGMYANATASECSTITNTPSDMPIGEMFLLVVPMGATNYIAQILIGKNGVTFSVYLRVLNYTTWSDWKKMAL